LRSSGRRRRFESAVGLDCKPENQRMGFDGSPPWIRIEV
jgi:hypothetical protein